MLTVALRLRLSGWVQHIKTVRVGSTYQNIKRYFDTMYTAVYSVYYTPWHGKIWSPYFCIVCLITFLDYGCKIMLVVFTQHTRLYRITDRQPVLSFRCLYMEFVLMHTWIHGSQSAFLFCSSERLSSLNLALN